MLNDQPIAPLGLMGGSKTRVMNAMMQAKAGSLGNNQAALNSLRPRSSGVKRRPRDPVGVYGSDVVDNDGGGAVGNSEQVTTGVNNLIQTPNNGISGSGGSFTGSTPAVPHVASHPSSGANVQEMLQQYQIERAAHSLAQTPEMMDTVTRLTLRNYFHGKSNDLIAPEAFGVVSKGMGFEQ